MQRKIFCALFVCATLLLMAPALMAEENTSEKTMERASQILETVDVQKAEATVVPDRNEQMQRQAAEAGELGLPVAAVATVASASLSFNETCQPCNTHADCASVCGGGQPFTDYICHWTFPQVCGSHIKQCSCN